MNTLAKFFFLLGIIFLGLGIIFSLGEKLPWWGKLPGDILIEKKNFSFYFPFTTCILLSIFLSLILWFIMRLMR
ncbi:MAG: DUF2905 domain-containing protein [Candidatus Omnitrophica bacterium]|nr:DUF2905 domain-containing protein [Candidatus Omnitrophota bacterium]MCM8793829.1 DUF2905 domain-containing protein [Candidatus Omnitrophota bacterium]